MLYMYIIFFSFHMIYMEANFNEDIATKINDIGHKMKYTKTVKKGDVAVLLHPLRNLTRSKLNMIVKVINQWKEYGFPYESIPEAKKSILLTHYIFVFTEYKIQELNNGELYSLLLSPILVPGCGKNLIVELMENFALILDR